MNICPGRLKIHKSNPVLFLLNTIVKGMSENKRRTPEQETHSKVSVL